MKLLILIFLISNYSLGNERIISTAPSITEMLGYFNEQNSVVAVSTYCKKPKKLCKKEKIGSMITLDLEKVIALKPTVVMALKLNNTSEINKLKKINIKVLELSFNSLDDIKKSFQTMGNYLGKKEKVKEFIKDLDNELHLMPIPFRAESFAIVIGAELSHGKISSVTLAGKNTYFSDIISFPGHINIFEKTAMTYPNLSLEQLIKKNPERIWVIQEKIKRETKKAWINLKNLQAVKNKKIKFITGHHAVIPGPYTITLAKEIRESF
jgi:iron complex transport system substrate-binding protein